MGARSAGLEHIVLDQTPIPVTFTWKTRLYESHNLTPDGGPIGFGYDRGISHNKIEDTKEEHIELSVRALDRLAEKTMAWLSA